MDILEVKNFSISFCEAAPACMDLPDRVQKAKEICDVLAWSGVALVGCFIPVSLRKETVS